MEGQILWCYFENHGEYPPIKYTQTKCRNSKYDMEINNEKNK